MGKIIPLARLLVGSTFDVEVDDGAKVGELKEPIEQENPNTLKDVDAPNLQLFLAKKTDGKWLSATDAMAVTLDTTLSLDLDEHERHQGFKWLNPALRFKNLNYFGDNFQPDDDQVHVLVVVPKWSAAKRKREVEEVISGFDTLAIAQLAHHLSESKLAVESLVSGLPENFLDDFAQRFIRSSRVFGRLCDDHGETGVCAQSPSYRQSWDWEVGVWSVLVPQVHDGRRDVAYHPAVDSKIYYFTWTGAGDYEASLAPHPGKTYEGFFDENDHNTAFIYGHFRHVYLLASPRRENFNHFRKDSCFTVYLNPWTKAECEEFASNIHVEDEGEWIQRFKLFAVSRGSCFHGRNYSSYW